MKLNFKEANVIFFYLLPKNIEQLKEKINSGCQKGTLVISYRFIIEGLKKKLSKTLPAGIKFAYYYRI